MPNSEQYHFQNREDEPISYFEMGRGKAFNRSIGQNTVDAVKQQEKTHSELTNRVKTIIAGVVLTAIVATAAIVDDGPDINTPKSQQTWEDVANHTFQGTGDLQLTYNESGSNIEFTSFGNHYYLEDTDNDTYAESGKVTRADDGKTAEFSSEDGIPLHAAVSRLDGQLAKIN